MVKAAVERKKRINKARKIDTSAVQSIDSTDQFQLSESDDDSDSRMRRSGTALKSNQSADFIDSADDESIDSDGAEVGWDSEDEALFGSLLKSKKQDIDEFADELNDIDDKVM